MALRQVPTLIIWGMADSFVTVDHLRRWQQVLPEAKVLEAPKAGHVVQDEAGDVVAPAFAQFLR